MKCPCAEAPCLRVNKKRQSVEIFRVVACREKEEERGCNQRGSLEQRVHSGLSLGIFAYFDVAIFRSQSPP